MCSKSWAAVGDDSVEGVAAKRQRKVIQCGARRGAEGKAGAGCLQLAGIEAIVVIVAACCLLLLLS